MSFPFEVLISSSPIESVWRRRTLDPVGDDSSVDDALVVSGQGEAAVKRHGVVSLDNALGAAPKIAAVEQESHVPHNDAERSIAIPAGINFKSLHPMPVAGVEVMTANRTLRDGGTLHSVGKPQMQATEPFARLGHDRLCERV